jgi:hypothetical protein
VNPNKIKEDLVGLDYDKKKVESTIINIIKNQGESIYA